MYQKIPIVVTSAEHLSVREHVCMKPLWMKSIDVSEQAGITKKMILSVRQLSISAFQGIVHA